MSGREKTETGGSRKTAAEKAEVVFQRQLVRLLGTTASDFDPEEIRRKASLNSSVVPVEYEGI